MAEQGFAPAVVLGPHGRIVSIRFCAPDELRIRKVIYRARYRETIKYPGIKPNRHVHCEERDERNLCVLMDCDPEICIYSEQPCEIVYRLNGEEHHHFPDFLVDKSQEKELVEVEDSAEAKKLEERTVLLQKELPYYGYGYRVEIAEELKQQPRLKVSEKVVKFGRRPITPGEREFIRRTLLSNPVLTWGRACQGEYGIYGREMLCSLVIDGVLTVDTNSPLTARTAFSLRKGAM